MHRIVCMRLLSIKLLVSVIYVCVCAYVHTNGNVDYNLSSLNAVEHIAEIEIAFLCFGFCLCYGLFGVFVGVINASDSSATF